MRNGMLKAMALGATAAMCLLAAGCRQDMQDQPKIVPQRGSAFFADERSVRPQVDGTVARGQLHEDAYFYTGVLNGKEADLMPFPVTLTVLERGQERFNIYCSTCHSRVGNGLGMIVQRGYKPAGDLQSGRLLAAPISHYFRVMSKGYGAMPDYAAQLTPQDRWAVAAYIRALQLSQHAKPADVAAGEHAEPLDEIAKREGLSAGFVNAWPRPATAVFGTTSGTDNAILPALPQPAAKAQPAVKQ
jgi:cytochrome c553